MHYDVKSSDCRKTTMRRRRVAMKEKYARIHSFFRSAVALIITLYVISSFFLSFFLSFSFFLSLFLSLDFMTRTFRSCFKSSKLGAVHPKILD